MSIPKNYHFQLKDCERKICETWREIQTKSEFHDVTLACDENQLNAHKVILSSFSPVLLNLLRNIDHQHPLIYLRGIRYSILSNIIEFIYKGEVSISQETIKDFLSVANELRIKGLSEENRQEAISVNISEPDFFVNYIDNSNSSNPVPDKYNEEIVDPTDVIQVAENHKSLKHNYNENNEIEQLVETGDYALVQVHSDEQQRAVTETTEQVINEDYNKEAHKVISMKKEIKDLQLFYCEECDHKTTYKNNLTKHVKSQHQGIRYSCEKCDFSFKTQAILKQHVDSKHLGVQYSCNICDHSSTDKSNLRKHIATQHEGVRHSCDKCEQSYADKYHLMEHIKTKHEGFRHYCKYCNNSYVELRNLKKHISSQHKDENAVENNGKTISCDKCGKQFLFLGELIHHKSVVHNEKIFSCDQCDFQNTSKSNLKKHIASIHD